MGALDQYLEELKANLEQMMRSHYCDVAIPVNKIDIQTGTTYQDYSTY